MIQEVVEAALTRALESLSPRFGLRSHALPTEDSLAECVAAIAAVVADRALSSAYVVIGSSQHPSGPLPENFSVLPCDDAAAEATRIRSEIQATDNGLHLLYFNSDSTPGEAGLAELDELTVSDIAHAFASMNGLGQLEALASSNARVVRARVLDAGITELARYAELSKEISEQFAAPLLGFLTGAQTGAGSAIRATRAFDALTGPRAVEALKASKAALEAVEGPERERVEAALRAYLGDDAPRPLQDAIKLCASALAYASGQVADPEGLCGLTPELASALRSGKDVISRLVGEARQETEARAQVTGAMTDAEILRVEGGQTALSGSVRDEEAEELDGENDIPRLSIAIAEEDVPLRPNGRAAFLRALLEKMMPDFWLVGGTLLVTDRELQGDDLTRIPVDAMIDWSHASAATGVLPPELMEPTATFFSHRKELFELVSRLGLADDAPTSVTRAIQLLEHFALIVAAQFPDALDRYIESYRRLLQSAVAFPMLQNKFVAWLADLDTGLSTDRNRTVRSACLLPAHPLRLAHARLWLAQTKEPPALPMTLGVHYMQPQPLFADGRDYAYSAINAGSPNDTGLAAVAREGLDAAWSLLARRGLATALQIEIVDVARPAVIINELVEHSSKLLDDDADAPGIHLDVRITYSNEARDREIDLPTFEQFSEEAMQALSSSRGSGVSVRVGGAKVLAGKEPCDLSIEAVDAPYVRLPDVGMAVSLPDTELVYRPGRAGNIALVEIQGFEPLDQYNQLLIKQLNISPEARGLDPIAEPPRSEHSLIRALVAKRGWPIPPHSAKTLVSRQEVEDHVIVTLLVEDVFASIVPSALAQVSTGAPDFTADRVVSGVVGLYSCRSFVRAALSEDPDLRDLRGKLGKLRAFAAARAWGGVERLVLDLDSSEGMRWTQTVTSALGLDNKKRCDLLFVDVDAMAGRALRLTAVELKAGESKNSISDKNLGALAYQAQLTASRLRKTFELGGERRGPVREALRRLYWMGAGSQQRALDLQAVLEDLDARLAKGDPPSIAIECWIVPEENWPDEPVKTLSLKTLDPNGGLAGGEEEVVFHILDPVAPPQHAKPAAPSPPGKAQATKATAGKVKITAAMAAKAETIPSGGASSSKAPELNSPEGGASITDGSDSAAPSQEASPSAVPPQAEATSGSSSQDGMRIVFGNLAATGEPAVWMPNRTDLVNHFNIGITGTMGTGKTQFTKSLLAQMLWGADNNVGHKRPGILIFDYKGDYCDSERDPFATTMTLNVLPPEELPINPLRYVRPTTRQQFVALPRMFAETLRAIDSRMGNVQRNEIIRAVQECYATAGITDEPSTWGRRFPTLRDLFGYMEANEIGTGTPQSIIQDLVDFRVFASADPAEDLDGFFDGSNVINLRPLAGTPTLIRAVLCFFMNAFYDRMVQTGEARLEQRGGNSLRHLRRLVLVDEADDFISLNLRSLILTMQQGRSFGHGVILSTQFLHHFNQNETPLRPLIGTWILHQMADLNVSDVKALFGLSSRTEVNERSEELSSLPQHTSLCLGLSNAGLRSQLTRVRDLPYKDLPKPVH